MIHRNPALNEDSAAILSTWQRVQDERRRRIIQRDSTPVRSAPRSYERVGMYRCSLQEVAQLFGWSEQEVRSRVRQAGFDGVGVEGKWTVFLPEPVPSALRDAYEQTWDELLDVLADRDPVGLIAIGAPRDEYHPEMTTIMPRLGTARGAADVQRIVQEEYAQWFTEESARDQGMYEELACHVWTVWCASSWGQRFA